MEEKPIEIFAEVPFEAGNDESGQYSQALYMERKSYWDAICRQVSLNLRNGTPVDKVAKQLQKSCPTLVDLPSILRRVLQRFMNTKPEEIVKIKNKEIKGEYCIECKEYGVIYQGGCKNCILCGKLQGCG